MIVLYIFSDDRRAGKTSLGLALGRRFAQDGLAVGYWKPFGEAGPAAEDAALAKSELHLPEDAATIGPVTPPANENEPAAERRRRLAPFIERVAKGKDLLLVEGGEGLASAAPAPLPVGEILNLLRSGIPGSAGVRALYLARYRDGDLAGRIAAGALAAGQSFCGALVNGVPKAHEWFVGERVVPPLAAQGIGIWGVLPQDVGLLGATVRELATYLGARVLVNEDEPGMDELFESVMFGSMSAEDGLRYFSRKERKVVVTRGDRPDVHMAALGTSTRCLLLTGGYPSYPFVLDRAEDLGVPVLSVGEDMPTTIDRLDQWLAGMRTRSSAKVRRFEELLARHVDWDAAYNALGIERKARAERA